MDEATSALDSDNEAKIQTALDHLMQDRTTIMITHRLSSVQKADRIIVMDQGEIVQIGTHQQLIETPGLYKELVERQDDNILKAV